MAASESTVEQIAKVLIEEIGLEKAIKIADRLFMETHGNASYMETTNRLFQMLKKRKVK